MGLLSAFNIRLESWMAPIFCQFPQASNLFSSSISPAAAVLLSEPCLQRGNLSHDITRSRQEFSKKLPPIIISFEKYELQARHEAINNSSDSSTSADIFRLKDLWVIMSIAWSMIPLLSKSWRLSRFKIWRLPPKPTQQHYYRRLPGYTAVESFFHDSYLFKNQ